MIASVCYAYQGITPAEVRAMPLGDVEALIAYARKVSDASRR